MCNIHKKHIFPSYKQRENDNFTRKMLDFIGAMW